MKNIVLIRHGESLGQTARHRGLNRSDPSLVDCFLTNKGIQQASQLRCDPTLTQYNFDLVCTSPLTRALSTCILALGHIIEGSNNDEGALPASANSTDREENPAQNKHFSSGTCIQPNRVRPPFIARADICEFGGKIPENHGRPVHKVVKDLEEKLASRLSSPPSAECLNYIDFSMLPSCWPKTDNEQNDRKHSGIERFLSWLAGRPEETVAVVCHYNVIKWMLRNTISHVSNCTPIECVLTDDGVLVLKSEFDSVRNNNAPLDTFWSDGARNGNRDKTGKLAGKSKREKHSRRKKR